MIIKNYIKMCEMAEEIQKLFKFKMGDWFLHTDYSKTEYPMVLEENIISVSVQNTYRKEGAIWLPTQEQLQKMVKTVLEVDDFGLVEEFYNFIYDEESRPNQIDSPIKSMEQFWLAFVMHELYNKIWTGEKWVKAE